MTCLDCPDDDDPADPDTDPEYVDWHRPRAPDAPYEDGRPMETIDTGGLT